MKEKTGRQAGRQTDRGTEERSDFLKAAASVYVLLFRSARCDRFSLTEFSCFLSLFAQMSLSKSSDQD